MLSEFEKESLWIGSLPHFGIQPFIIYESRLVRKVSGYGLLF